MYDYMKSLQRQFETEPEYIQNLKVEVNQMHKELSAQLSKEDRRLLLKLVDLEDTLCGEATLHSFVSGYRLACGIHYELSAEPVYSFDKEEEDRSRAMLFKNEEQSTQQVGGHNQKEMKTLRQEDISAYLKAADARGVLPMFLLELTSGLRKGELVALLWSDLDVERKTLSVSKQAVRAEGGEIKVTRPKTATSIRKISIPQEAVDLLIQEHDKHPDNPYMFPSPKTGGMWFPDSVVNLHAKILKDAGLEHLRFHDLRHTFATMALQNGVDVKTVSSMLGHYDAGFTLSVYAHATDRMQEEAAEKMGSFMAQAM